MRLIQTIASLASGAIGRESSLVRSARPYYERLLDVTSLGRGVPWQMNGVEYRIDPAQRHRFAPEYDAPVAAFLRDRIAPNARCFNVGANVGVYVLQLARWSAPLGRVVAFEPNPLAAAVLERHVRYNALEDRVEVVRAAVGSRGGVGVLHAWDTDGMSRLGSPNARIAAHTRPVAVPLVSLDDYTAATGEDPDVIFMDIEGAEVEALEGARALIERARGRLLLVVEFHPSVWSQSPDRLLESLRLRARPLTGQRDVFSEHGIVHLEAQG